MKQLILTTLFAIFAVASQGAQKIAMGSSGVDEVVILDKASGKIEARYPIGKGGECNCVYVDDKGNLVFSYKRGAKMISADGKEIWNYTVPVPEELQSVVPTKKGFAMAICGKPARIVEVDKKGKVISETKFDLAIEDPHGQFRQIAVLPDGTYLVPVMSKGEVINIDKNGKQIGKGLKVKGNLFSLVVLPNGNYIVSAGDAHCAIEVDPKTGKTVREIANIDGARFAFVAQTQPRKDGSMLIANWLGHLDKGDRNLPHVVEIDKDGKLIWSYKNKEHNMGISAIYEFNK